MNKNIDYYMSLPYRRELVPEPEGGWFIRILELPGCMSQGDTVEEAHAMIEDAMRGWLETELKNGAAIPEPRQEEEFSGKFVLRVAKSLHRKIDECAEREEVSINQWINTALAEAVGQAFAFIPEKTEQSAESSIVGLNAAMGNILQDLGLNRKDVLVDEALFGEWLEQNLAEIRQDCQSNQFETGLSRIRALHDVIAKHARQSPVMRSILALLQNQIVILEATCAYKNKADQADQLRAQISSIIGNVNPIQPSVLKFESEDRVWDKTDTIKLFTKTVNKK